MSGEARTIHFLNWSNESRDHTKSLQIPGKAFYYKLQVIITIQFQNQGQANRLKDEIKTPQLENNRIITNNIHDLKEKV